jgi:hypothetical protein
VGSPQDPFFYTIASKETLYALVKQQHTGGPCVEAKDDTHSTNTLRFPVITQAVFIPALRQSILVAITITSTGDSSSYLFHMK